MVDMNDNYQEALKKIIELYNQGNLDDAVTFTIDFLNENYSDLSTDKGTNFLNEIEANASEWIEQQPTYQAFFIRGLASSDKQEYDSAIEDYTKAIELNPQDQKAYTNRGIAYGNKGDYTLL